MYICTALRRFVMQVLRPGDEMQINTGAIINHPFSATGRYTVEPAIAQEHQQIVSMQLVLRGKNVILMLKPISRVLLAGIKSIFC